MASSVYLTSTVLMGLFALSVFLVVSKGRAWYDYSPRIGRPEPGWLARVSGDTRVWIVAFVVLVLAVAGGTLAVLGGASTSLTLAGAGLLLVVFFLVGVYGLARSRGHPHAYAVGEAVIALGAIFLIGITGLLLSSFGA